MPCSSYMLVMMTVDRFQDICYPLTNQGWLHEHSLKVSYLGIWLGKVGVSNASLSRGLVRSRSWNSFRLGLNLIHILFANASIIRSCKLPNGSSSSFSANWHLPHGHYSCDLGFLLSECMLLSRRYLRGGNLAGWCWPPGSSRCSSVFPRHTSFARGKREGDSRSIKSACVNICKVDDRPLFDRRQRC